MANELFGTPKPERSTMSRIGAALGGFGAGVQGKGQEYLTGLQERRAEEEKKRLTAMVKDAKQAYDFINRGDVNNAMSLIQDRVKMIGELGGDPSDTARIGAMLESGRIAEAQNELRGFLRPFMPTEAIKASELTPTGQRVSFDPLTGQVSAEDVSGFRAEPASRETYQDRMGVTRYKDTGRTVYEESQAGMAATQPTAQAQASQTGAAEPSPEDAYLAGLSPSDRAIAEAEIEANRRTATEFEQEQAAIADQEQMVIDEAKTAYMIAKELRDNVEGLKGAVGPISSRLPSFSEDTIEFESKLDYLQSLLTLGNLGRMTGVLSESDLALLSKAASGLDTGVGEKAFTQQLNTIINNLEKGLLAKEVDLSTISRPSTRTGDWRSTQVFDEVLRNEGLLNGG